MKNILFVLSIFIISFACQPKEESTTIYLVRHAEKDLTDSSRNPQLTAEGVKRAEKLTEMLKDEGITAVFSTGLDRTINTVKGSADLQNLEVQLYDYLKPEEMLEQIKNGAQGKTVLIGGHSDNLFPMMDYLSAKRPQDSLRHDEYDKLFKLELKADTVLVETIVY